MERNNLLVRKIMLLTIGGFLTTLLSCSKLPSLTSEDLVGQWKSSMNEILILYADSTFEAKDILISSSQAKDMFSDASEIRIGGKGTWKIYKNWLCLAYSSFVKNSEKIEKGYNFTLSIKGSGFFENRLPWKIVNGIGNDEGITVLKKIE